MYQIVHELTTAGIGQSTCIGMGGDPVHGVGFIEALSLFEADADTDLIIMTGEIGGDDEERAAEYVARARVEAGRRLHRGVRGAARQADGPRRRDRDRIAGTAAAKAEALEAVGVAVAPDALAGGARSWPSAWRDERPGVGRASRSRRDTRPGDLARLAGCVAARSSCSCRCFVAGQALAWLTYAASGWYHPWSWFKIGLAETLASVRVPFAATADASPLTHAVQSSGRLEVAIGALTIAVLVLAFAPGASRRERLERRPGAAALAGSAIALGFALPMLVVGVPGDAGVPAVRDRAARAGAVAGVRDAARGRAGPPAQSAASRSRGTRSRSASGLGPSAQRVGGATTLWWGVVGGVRRVAARGRGLTGSDRRLRAVRVADRRQRRGDGDRACVAAAEPVGVGPRDVDGRDRDPRRRR